MRNDKGETLSALLTFQQVQEILGEPKDYSDGWLSRLRNWFYHGRQNHNILREPSLPARIVRRRGSIYLRLDSLVEVLEHEVSQMERGAELARSALRNLRAHERALKKSRVAS